MILEKVVKNLQEEFKQLEQKVSDPNIVGSSKYTELIKRYTFIENILSIYKNYEKIKKQIESDNAIIEDGSEAELIELAKSELEELGEELKKYEIILVKEIIPPSEEDERIAIMEIRAGTGGDEATLFAAELYRMYTKYSENKGWKTEVLHFNGSGVGGVKEVIFKVNGKSTYKFLKYESGVHRVQRIPQTESQGRLHTSAVTIAVFPEVKDVELQIKPEELRIDIFRSSGPGGQGVNTTDSAVRITHIPTNIVVTCQDERSQIQNKARAMTILRSRLYDKKKQEEEARIHSKRRLMIGSGDRSEKIRTYNYPQNRITDHRIKFSLYNLEGFLSGELDELIEKLIFEDNLKKLEMYNKDGK
ncbi:peptide chain release factor 1 [bacterium]|nr:peptide chain release factor 1 [bacterium]